MNITLLSIENRIATITLNYPEKHNILNPTMITALSSAYTTAENNIDVDVIILKANGKHFCAGADLHYMLEMGNSQWDINFFDAKKFAHLFYQIHHCKKITIACAHGNVRGGGIGLFCAHDFAFAHTDTTFAFTEVKLGLVPAIISPYVLQRIPLQHAKLTMLTAEIINTTFAKSIGLLDDISHDVYQIANNTAQTLQKNNAFALSKTKAWLHNFQPITEEKMIETAELLAHMRANETTKSTIKNFIS